jgi:ribosomal protein S1
MVGGDVRTGKITEFKSNDRGRYGAIIAVCGPVSGMVHVSALVGGSKRLETLELGDELQYRVVSTKEVEMRNGRAGLKHLNVALSELSAVLDEGAHFSHAEVIKDFGTEIMLAVELDGHRVTVFLQDLSGVKNRASLTRARNQAVAVNFSHFDDRGRVIVTKA